MKKAKWKKEEEEGVVMVYTVQGLKEQSGRGGVLAIVTQPKKTTKQFAAIAAEMLVILVCNKS